MPYAFWLTLTTLSQKHTKISPWQCAPAATMRHVPIVLMITFERERAREREREMGREAERD